MTKGTVTLSPKKFHSRPVVPATTRWCPVARRPVGAQLIATQLAAHRCPWERQFSTDRQELGSLRQIVSSLLRTQNTNLRYSAISLNNPDVQRFLN